MGQTTATAPPLDDETWQALTRDYAPRTWPRIVLAAVLTLAMGGGALAAGAIGPRLVATPLAFGVDVTGGTVALDVRLTNVGLLPASNLSVMYASGIEVRAVEPAADGPRRFRDFTLPGRGSRDVRLILSLPCLAEPAQPWAVRMVAYGPNGGQEVWVPLAQVPAVQVEGGDDASVTGGWQEELVEAAPCSPEERRSAELAGSPFDAQGRPLALADGRPLPAVPDVLAQVVVPPVAMAVPVAQDPGVAGGCFNVLEDPVLAAGFLTPEGLALAAAGRAADWTVGESSGAPARPVLDVVETCAASWVEGAWVSNGSTATGAAEGDVVAGDVVAGDHITVPAGARWAVVDRGTYRVAYDVSGVAVLPVWWDAGGLFGTVRLLDEEGRLLAERAIGP